MIGLDTHEVTIARGATTQGSAGGPATTYSTNNRGGRPTKWTCRAVLMSAKEKLDHGVRANKLAWKFMGVENPQITEEDRLTFDFTTDDSHTVKVIVPSHARSADVAYWRVYGEEDKTES